MNLPRTLPAVVIVAAVGCWIAGADEIDDTFNSLYGKDIRRVKGTSDRKDDLAVAKELLKAARAVAGQAKLLTLLCENAYDLAEKAPGGEAIASAAMELLAEKVPAKKDACLARIVRVREQRYYRSKAFERVQAGEMLLDTYIAAAEAKADSADFSGADLLYRKALRVAARIKSARVKEIQARSERLKVQERIARDLRILTGRLKDNPKDKFARGRLIQLYVIELDNPVEAAKWVNADCGESVRTLVPLAGKKVEDLAPAACLELGDWYRGLADGSVRLAGVRPSDVAKPPLLRRAKRCYERCLQKHAEKDLLHTRAALGLGKVRAALEAAGEDISTGQLLDLLKLVDPSKDLLCGRCYREDGALSVEHRYGGQVMVPLVLQGSYELRAGFSLAGAQGRGPLFFLPVGQTNTPLHLGEGQVQLWLRPAAATSVQKADLPLPRPLGPDRRHVFEARVEPRGKLARITVAVNGRRCLRWQGPCAALGRWTPDHRCPVLGTHGRKVTYHTVHVRMLSGTATPLRKTVAGKEVKVLVGKPLANGKWVDLLGMIDLDLDCQSGHWRQGTGGITCEGAQYGPNYLLAPVQPRGGYRLRLSFTSTGRIDVLLPVAEGSIVATLDEKEGKLGDVEAKGVAGNVVTTRPGRVTKDRKHDLEVEVRLADQQAEIKVVLDGRPYLRWKGPKDELRRPIRLAFGHRSWKGRRLATYVHYTNKVTFHSMKFQPLTGSSVRIR